MPPQGEVARQWFIPGEGIDRGVITADIQRYLGNDATVRPGVGNGEYQGIQGYWIKAYRNFTSAMIQDLRADSLRWRQEQRQNGVSDAYVDSRTYNESNAARVQRDGNSPSIDVYGAPARSGPRDGRPGDTRRPPGGDAMQIDPPAGRAPPNQVYGQPGYYPPDARGQQYPPDPRYPAQGRPGPGYAPEQSMADVYGQPDAYGRYSINYGQPDRSGGAYPPQGQVPPPGYTAQGNYYVPITTGYQQQPGMVATSGADYYGGQQPPQQQRGSGPQGQRPPQRESYDQQNFNQAYPSPAQTVAGPQDQFVNPPRGSGYPAAQPQYDQYSRPISNPTYPYQQDPSYPPPQGRDPQSRDGRDGRGPQPSGQGDRSGRRARG